MHVTPQARSVSSPPSAVDAVEPGNVPTTWRNRLLVAGTLLFGLGCTALAVHLAADHVRRLSQARFELLTERLSGETRHRAELSGNGLKGIRGLYAASNSIERKEFEAYVSTRDMPKEFPGALGFGFIERVRRADLDRFIAAERADGAPDFAVRAALDAKGLAGESPDLYVIKHLFPREANLKVWGYDIGSEPLQRIAVERAVQTGEPTISGKVGLQQVSGEHVAVRCFVPVYKRGTNPKTAAERSADLEGLFYAPILLEAALDRVVDVVDGELKLAVFDGVEANDDHLLYDSAPHAGGVGGPLHKAARARPLFEARSSIPVGGRTWMIVTSTTPKFEAAIDRSLPWGIGLGGMLFSGMLALIVWSLGQSQSRALALAMEMTAELRASEEGIRRAKEEAEQANSAKSSFLANMSHEIRTPMNGIIGMAQLLGQTDLRSHQRDYLTTIRESAQILLRLLNDILDFSKIEAGKLELECVDFGLAECVARASQMVVLRAAEKGLEVACRVAPEIPDFLRGDPGRIQQVLVNLLGNAVKFTTAGEIYVNIEAESITPDVARLHFSVSDTGIGIPADKLNQIFRPFEQAEASTTRRFGGTGLGLAISRQLVEMMHGRMWVQSEPDCGSTFHFTCELGVATNQHLREPAELDSLQDLPVLVIDDNFTNRRILSEMLQHWRMRPILADSAAAARQSLQDAEDAQRSIRLILLDHHMPGEDGLQFAESVRDLLKRRQCRVIMISSGSSPVDADHCQQCGISRFMTKPVIASELLDEVLRQFGRYTIFKPDQPQTTSMHEYVQPRRVLLVEDNEINRRVALGLLHSRGHHSVCAANGEEALRILAEQEFDVVLMDMQMPILDGYEATIEIRQRELRTGGHVPIVAMTAEALKGDRERCLATGMDDYISKPIVPDEMYRAIERFPAISAPTDAGAKDLGLNGAAQAARDAGSKRSEAPTESTVLTTLPAIDWAVARARLPGSDAERNEFAVLLRTETKTQLRDIHRAIELRDSKLLRHSAHTMKGCASCFGAEPLVQAALALEILGRAESFDGIGEMLPRLEQELARVLAALDVGPANSTF